MPALQGRSPGELWPTPTLKPSLMTAGGPVMLVRREGESFVALLRRLDRSIGKAWDNETIIEEVNG